MILPGDRYVLPARLRLLLTAGDRLADSPEVSRRFEDIRDQQSDLLFASLDNMLSYWHDIT